MIGKTISHYTVLGEVRRGGMGIVYRARDNRLKREVAIKVLPPDLLINADRRRRFVQEAQAAAGLQHPNIAVVHEIDEVEGVSFIVMELIQGSSLKEVLDGSPIRVVRALRIGRQIAMGLACAHENGIVHRDLKPANVMVLAGDHVKIIDFGLAKLVEGTVDDASHGETALRRETASGTLLGTMGYMSPEQARGQPLDRRSDIFSLGTLLYEMIVGRPPFERSSAADTLSAVLKEAPEHPKSISSGIWAVIERCVAKQPADRYTSATELESALASQEDALLRPGSKPWRPLFVAVALIALFAGAWWVSGRRTSSVASQPENLTILIGDFENRTGESVFNGAIEQALAISLEGAPFINAFDRARARDQVVELAPESDGRLDEASTRLICRSHGIELALMGSVERDPSRSGSAYRVHVRAIDPVTAEVLSEVSEPVPDKASVLRVVDRLATELRGAFGDLNPTSRQAFQDETFTTSSLDAMQLYATAQELTDAGRFEEAFSAYKEAISHDAEFGRAYTGIGIALMNLDRSTEAGPYFDRALSLTHRMTERERFLARGTYYMFSRNYPKAIDEYSELIREFPSEETPNLPLAHFFCYDFEEAFAASQRMQEREPTLLRRLNTAIYATYIGRFDVAIGETESVLRENPAYRYASIALGLARLSNGDLAGAEEAYRQLGELDETGADLAALGLADLALYRGDLREAKRILLQAFGHDVDSRPRFVAAKQLIVLSEIAVLENDSGAARDRTERALSLSEDIGTRFQATEIYLRLGARAEAATLTDAMSNENAMDSRALAGVLRAEASLLDGHPEAAIRYLNESQQIADTWLGRYALGRSYLEAQAYVEAASEFETSLRRKGEATALFLDDSPSFRYVANVHYFLARTQEALGSVPGAIDSYTTYLKIKKNSNGGALVEDAKQRLDALR